MSQDIAGALLCIVRERYPQVIHSMFGRSGPVRFIKIIHAGHWPTLLWFNDIDLHN